MAAEKSEYIKKAYEDLNRISADEEKRLEYEARERADSRSPVFFYCLQRDWAKRDETRPKNCPHKGVARGGREGPQGGRGVCEKGLRDSV